MNLNLRRIMEGVGGKEGCKVIYNRVHRLEGAERKIKVIVVL